MRERGERGYLTLQGIACLPLLSPYGPLPTTYGSSSFVNRLTFSQTNPNPIRLYHFRDLSYFSNSFQTFLSQKLSSHTSSSTFFWDLFLDHTSLIQRVSSQLRSSSGFFRGDLREKYMSTEKRVMIAVKKIITHTTR